jgi:hypothetical protein
MKKLSLNRIFFYSMLYTLLQVSCKAPSTQMHSGSEFSNIRAELLMVDGTTQTGYTSINLHSGDQHLTFVEPGKRSEKQIPISKVEKLKMEDHEFVVKMIQTPDAAVREGKSKVSRVILKRLGMEADTLQVYEYKYKINNPKSPIKNTMTAWYIEFPGNAQNEPLCTMGTGCYKQKWIAYAKSRQANEKLVSNAPQNVKSLLDQVRFLENIQP